MRIITEIKYEATDGMCFDTEEECKEHEECISYEHKLGKLSYLVNTKLSHSMISTFIYKNYAEIKEIMEDVPEVKAEVDWSKVPEGTTILVRDYPYENWVERKFIRVTADNSYICLNRFEDNLMNEVLWKFAKLKE